MAIHLEKYDIAYFPVPKCACTSLKFFFFELENGFGFRPFYRNGKLFNIHNVYRSVELNQKDQLKSEGRHRIAVVRNPVERIVSAYSNRVLHHNELDPKHFGMREKLVGLKPRPDLSTFIQKIELYRTFFPPIRHHTQPLHHFLGKDPRFFSRIYNLRQLPQLVDDMHKKIGEVPELQRLQTGGPKIKGSDLSTAERSKINRIYVDDYKYYGEFFVKDASTE